MAFIDYEKAFDSIEINAILEALKNQGIDLTYIQLIENIYKNSTASIKINNLEAQINIKRGIRQGDCMSPILFNACLEEIFKKLTWENKGIKICGEPQKSKIF